MRWLRWRARRPPQPSRPAPEPPPPQRPSWANERTALYDPVPAVRPYTQQGGPPRPRPIPEGGIYLECDG